MRVFVSYSGTEGLRLATTLKKGLRDGIDAYLFPHDQYRGLPVWDQLASEIEGSDVLLVICSETTNKSIGQRFEYNQALSLDKLVIPVTFSRNFVPRALRHLGSHKITQEDPQGEFKGLSTEIERSLEQKHKELEIVGEAKVPKVRYSPPRKDVLSNNERIKAEEIETAIREGYQRTSIVHMVCEYREILAGESTRSQSMQFASRFPIERDWLRDPSHIILLRSAGEAIAYYERNYLQDQLVKRSDTIKLRNALNETSLKEAVGKIRATGLKPDALFIPIQEYIKMMQWATHLFQHEPNGWSLLVDGASLRIYLSNKRAPLKSPIVLSSQGHIWTTKVDPSTRGRLDAVVGARWDKPDEGEVLVRTVFSYQAKEGSWCVELTG